MAPPHLMTLADLSVNQITRSLAHAAHLKKASIPILKPGATTTQLASTSLQHKSIALLFSKRSTRTRLAAETGAALLGGRALFLGKDDIQLGVNESPSDTAKVIGSMCQGIFARVGEHEEIEGLTSACTQRPFVSLAPNSDPRRFAHSARTRTSLRLRAKVKPYGYPRWPSCSASAYDRVGGG
ncbi:ornithine carbamoyltransferase [Tulasnella sp. 403]|nr:ornithine carbamoyltransferase [Tulasnella sp. 403]